jgi:hypothetical protein
MEGGLVRLIDASRLFSPTRFFLDGTTRLIACLHNHYTTAITHMSPDQRLSEPFSECIACSLLEACCTDRHRRVPHYSILHQRMAVVAVRLAHSWIHQANLICLANIGPLQAHGIRPVLSRGESQVIARPTTHTSSTAVSIDDYYYTCANTPPGS